MYVCCSFNLTCIHLGIGLKLMEKFSRPQTSTTIVVTPTQDRGNVRRGFDTQSPIVQSPAVSGRNTPEISSSAAAAAASDEQQRNLPKFIGQQQNRNAQQMFAKERGDEKQYIHMVVIGHVDAGKSTLMGHTLFDLGDVPQRVMHKYEQESKKLGKQSFMYAWVLDETGEERERGITMDVGSTRFATETKIVSFFFHF